MESLKEPVSQKEFWDLRAKTFPRYSPEPDNYEAGMLNLAKGIGADFKDKSILDVGCGTGMYTLRLAKEARHVTGLDISAEMLAINQADALKERIENIDFVNSDWLDFKPRRDYDLVFCSMTPALQSLEGKLKLLFFSGVQVVYFGFSAPMNNHVINELFKTYGLKLREFKSAPDLRAFLEAKGIPFQMAGTSGRWNKSLTKDEMVLNITSTLSFHGGDGLDIDLETFISQFADGQGRYNEITDYQVEAIVWTNP
jgi:SAM-dependent methyltransferase